MTSLVVHEAGHALAASCEGVRVEACGMFVWVLVPGAFVRLDLDDSTAPLKRVRQCLHAPLRRTPADFCLMSAHDLVSPHVLRGA